MNEGAFALLDCLGFKGVWNRGVTPEVIVKFMEDTKAHSEQLQVRRLVTAMYGTKVSVSIAFVSDSIAISVRARIVSHFRLCWYECVIPHWQNPVLA